MIVVELTSDLALLREALEALEKMSVSFKQLLAQVVVERGVNLKPEDQADVVRANAAITKLEQRLLNE